MADRSAARLWGEVLEAVIAVTERDDVLRAVWRIHERYDFTPDQANLSDATIRALKVAVGREAEEAFS